MKKRFLSLALTLTLVFALFSGSLLNVRAESIRETEPNDTVGTANHITVNTDVYGNTHRSNDTDYFIFVINNSGAIQVQFTGSGTPTNVSVYSVGTNLSTRLIQNNRFDSNATELADVLELQSGTYCIRVVNATGTILPDIDYSLRVIYTPGDVEYIITAIASPTSGGIVMGEGTYQDNASVTLTATPNTGFTFDGWYEGDTIVSTNATYTFIATANRTLQARFKGPATITATASPANGGTVTGAGAYQMNASVTLVATPNTGFKFDGWYEGSTRVSTNATYTFTATANRTLEARFTQNQTAQFPDKHSPWAAEQKIFERAEELGLIPDSLRGSDWTKPITRAEFAAIAVKTYEALSGTAALPAVTNPFTDTNNIDVLKAYNLNIMVGTAGDKFSPDTILNRETCATALTRVFKRVTMPGWTYTTDSQFPLVYTRPAPFADDAQISSWAIESVYFMAAHGIITGTGNNNFSPRATTPAQIASNYAQATREQALAIAVRMAENLGK